MRPDRHGVVQEDLAGRDLMITEARRFSELSGQLTASFDREKPLSRSFWAPAPRLFGTRINYGPSKL
jgi:hypothetical protein